MQSKVINKSSSKHSKSLKLSADNKSTLLYFWKNYANTSTTAANTSTTTTNMSTTASTKPRPAQEQTTNRLTEINNEITALAILDANGLLSSDQKLIHKKLIEERRGFQKKLKRLECEGAAEVATKTCAVDIRRTSTDSRSRREAKEFLSTEVFEAADRRGPA
jgi:hypothetical protein